MAAGKLANLEHARFEREVTPQKWFELVQIKLFARSYGRRMVPEIAHAKFPLAVREHCRVADMPVRIETAECKTPGAVKEFAPGRIPRHPGNLQGSFRRQMQGALH